ncbi:radical SAM family heme chaperone HemW, partial [bacterium]|nr:radical SAM family heme chaperone HemW [bacterium]
DTYLESLKNEIEKFYEGDTVKSIYIGGGTPSVLSINEIEFLFETLKTIKISIDAEITFEMNINDITEEKLKLLKKYGVNRLSIGIQSFDKKNQSFLNRIHNKKEIYEKISLVRLFGFKNINLDLMYAIPGETLSILKKDLKTFMKLSPTHISTYSLIIEDHTKLQIDDIKPIDENLDSKMYFTIINYLKKKGFKHYEVSNFAIPGKESIHNLNYWDNDEYYGFGLGSHGFINDVRYKNTRNFQEYIEGEYRVEELFVSTKEDMENEIMLGLRKIDGINIKKFYEKFKKNIQDEFDLKPLVKDKLLVLSGENLKIPEDKIYVMNEILIKIIK